MDILLIPGLWLDGAAWDAVLQPLTERGHRPHPVTLPGQGDGQPTATLDDQVAAVVTTLDACDGPSLVVGHSAACTLAWLAADRRRDRVAAVAMVGGMPQTDGGGYAPWFEAVDGRVPFPGWEPFAGPDSDDLDEATRERVAAGAHPVPEAVVQGVVHYGDPARKRVPVVMVCPEYSPDQAKAWVDAGDIPELVDLERLEYVDLDSGHWPMFSRPGELADLLADLADRFS